MITCERLKHLLNYDKSTGVFVWAVRRSAIQKGDVAGTRHSNGYTYICIDRRDYMAHRLAWLYVYGEFPSLYIDHINGKRSDNRISNLREASKKQNAHNSKTQSRNTSGFKGVSYYKPSRKWKAQIKVDGKDKFLGYFDTAIEASKYYETFAAAIRGEFHRGTLHGELK